MEEVVRGLTNFVYHLFEGKLGGIDACDRARAYLIQGPYFVQRKKEKQLIIIIITQGYYINKYLLTQYLSIAKDFLQL